MRRGIIITRRVQIQKRNTCHQNSKTFPSNLTRSPSRQTAQTAKNVGSVVKCAESKKPRLMFAQKSSKENEKKSLKRALNGMGFICGTSFQEFVMDTKN